MSALYSIKVFNKHSYALSGSTLARVGDDNTVVATIGATKEVSESTDSNDDDSGDMHFLIYMLVKKNSVVGWEELNFFFHVRMISEETKKRGSLE